MSKRVAGSIKSKIVATELVEERAKSNFDHDELYTTYYSDPISREIRERVFKEMEEDPILRNTHKFYEMTTKEAQLELMKKTNHMYFKKERSFYTSAEAVPELQWPLAYQGQCLFALHYTMF